MVTDRISVAPRATAERLRPVALRSKPVRVPCVFEEPDEVMRVICRRAPYPTLVAFHKFKSAMGEAGEFPWFLGALKDELFLQIPSFLAAAREAFSARIVRPSSCTLNLNAPMKGGPPHIDLPVFRGFAAPQVPIWLLMNMSYSMLFRPWLVPVASGLVWFYRGEGGAFEYWPDGPEGTPVREEPPLWNMGVMSDNESMWHRVGPIGPIAEQERLDGRLRASDELHCTGRGAWEIRDGERVVARLAPSELRISLLWKAFVFKDEDHLASFENPAMSLDADQVVEIYLQDLEQRGVTARRPSSPLEDPEWRRLLQGVYMTPFGGNSPYY